MRTGPLQLVKNDILILQLQTDNEGRLQGEYRAWDDAGELTESGSYRDGLKHGEWRYTDTQGRTRIVVYQDGTAQEP